MTDRTHLTLRVERDLHDGSIAGRVLDGGAADRSFSGWMGLAAAIEDALQAGAGRRAHPDETTAQRSRSGKEQSR